MYILYSIMSEIEDTPTKLVHSENDFSGNTY